MAEKEIAHVVISLEGAVRFYAEKCLRGDMVDAFVDVGKGKVVFEMWRDKTEGKAMLSRVPFLREGKEKRGKKNPPQVDKPKVIPGRRE